MIIESEVEPELSAEVRALLDHTPGGIYSVLRHPNGTREVKFVSDKFLEITEFTREELMGGVDPIPSRIHPDDLPKVVRLNQAAARSFEEIHSQFRLLCPSGNTKHIEGIARCQQLDNGSMLWYGVFLDVSQRFKFEQVFQEREQLNRRVNMMVRLSPGGLYNVITHLDGTSRLIFGSPKFYEMTGLTEDEVIANPYVIDELLHPDTKAKVFEANATALETMSHWHEEFMILRKDGRTLHVEGFSYPNLEPDGSVLWYGLIIDITERKKAQQVQLEKLSLERDLYNLSELSPAAQLIIRQEVNGSMHAIFFSRKMRDILGDDINKLNSDLTVIFSHVHPEDLTNLKQVMKGAIQKCEPLQAEFRIESVNSIEVWYELRIRPVQQEDGSVLWYGMFTNIDQRKNLEEARRMAYDRLKEGETKYRALAENIEVPITLVNPDGLILYANKCVAQLYRREIAQMIGQRWSVVSPETWEDKKLLIDLAISSNQKQIDILRLEDGDRERFFRRSFLPLRIDGRINQVLISGFEIFEKEFREVQYLTT
ncbi:MAG TPA: PAS domain-containing protein [Cyclobacteriaceae bacterium]|nr:PAS domain-containing protein [Cyclobacteriaceae bacterium]